MMKNNEKHFIRTSDYDTAKKLREEGFQEIGKSGNLYVFINDWSKQKFSENIDEKKIAYTNKMTM